MIRSGVQVRWRGEPWWRATGGAVRALVLLVALMVGAAGRGEAQEESLTARCAVAGAGDETRRFCNLVAQAVEVFQPRLGLAATGGNPVPGTASTLGMRIGALPRLSVGGRVTGVWVDMPPAADRGAGEALDFFPTSYNVDAAVGLFGGLSPAPTVGGLLSLDLLASLGLVTLSEDDGFGDTPFTWSVGARLGILRESFTLPGLSLSGMYRQVGDVTFGDPALATSDGYFDTGVGLWSLRAAISKQFGLMGATLGAGYDHYSSDVEFGVANADAAADVSAFRFEADDFDNDRFSAFANVSWTLLILHVIGEVGWQSGADAVPAALPAGVDIDPEDGAFFGSIALRLSI